MPRHCGVQNGCGFINIARISIIFGWEELHTVVRNCQQCAARLRKSIYVLSWRVSILKANGMFQTNCIVCIKRQSQSQLIVRSAVITSVMSVLLCREMSGELFLSGAGHDSTSKFVSGREDPSDKSSLPDIVKKR